MTDATHRCPGGYLIKGKGLCGSGGNKCVGRCAFAYRGSYALQETARPARALPNQTDSNGERG